jgi:hypothetical protein
MTYPPEEAKPLEIDVRPNGRYRVQSRTRPEVKHLVKWVYAEQAYQCSCEWGTMGDPTKACAHVFAVREKYGKICNLCASKGEHSFSMPCPWDKEKTIYLCERDLTALKQAIL